MGLFIILKLYFGPVWRMLIFGFDYNKLGLE